LQTIIKSIALVSSRSFSLFPLDLTSQNKEYTLYSVSVLPLHLQITSQRLAHHSSQLPAVYNHIHISPRGLYSAQLSASPPLYTTSLHNNPDLYISQLPFHRRADLNIITSIATPLSFSSTTDHILRQRLYSLQFPAFPSPFICSNFTIHSP